MKRLIPVVAAVALAAAGCSGGGTARLKGKIVDNGQPVTFPPTTASVQLSPLGEGGTPDPTKVYACVVNEDGSFEFLASGGELPPGTYQVVLELVGGKGPANAKAIAGKALKRELKSGSNDLVIDLAKPEG
jgi:hypothetical protein